LKGSGLTTWKIPDFIDRKMPQIFFSGIRSKSQILRGTMMKKHNAWQPIIILAIALTVLAGPARASQDGEQAVREAAAGFYTALNVLFTGNPDSMNEVWSHADDVIYMGPGGGVQVGWAQISENLKKQAAMKLGGKVEPAEMHLAVGQDLAVVQNYEKGTNTDAQGKQQKVSIRATSTFRKEDGKWKMIGHHTDLLPYLKD
jgi:ketosteroid isomerase-like protein